MSAPLKPIVKWIGGKRQLLPVLTQLLPESWDDGTYFEPFVGGGAVFLHFRPQRAVVNDLNSELINLYSVATSDTESLIQLVSSYANDKDFYYEMRSKDRDAKTFTTLTDLERAARTLYLNKTGFNGLYRVNSRGEFNVPFGRYKKLHIDPDNIRAVADYITEHDIQILNTDYRAALDAAQPGDTVYLDPPYDPVSVTSNFTSYQADGFSREDQRVLRDTFDELTERGVNAMLSNSNTEFIRELYSKYSISVVQARRNVNSNAQRRGAVEEVVVTNYGKTV